MKKFLYFSGWDDDGKRAIARFHCTDGPRMPFEFAPDTPVIDISLPTGSLDDDADLIGILNAMINCVNEAIS